MSAFGLGLIVVGLIGIVASGKLSNFHVRRHDPDFFSKDHEVMKARWRAIKGTGVVPSWVSLLNLLGWGSGVIGLILLFI